jgi:hypothetical protein
VSITEDGKNKELKYKGNNGGERKAGHHRHHREEITRMVWPSQKTPEEIIPKLIMEWIPEEIRKRARPRKTWIEGVQAAMTARNL